MKNSATIKGPLFSDGEFQSHLFDIAQTMILFVDPQARVIEFNPYMEQVTGYSVEELRGRDAFEVFVFSDDWERERALFEQAIGGSQTNGVLIGIKGKDGRRHEVEWYDKLVTDEQGRTRGILCVGHDISKRVEAEDALKRQLEHESRLSTMAARFVGASASEISRLIDVTLAEIGEFHGVDRCLLFLCGGMGDVVDYVHEWRASGLNSYLDEINSVDYKAFDWLFDALRDGELLDIPDAAALKGGRKKAGAIWSAQGVKSLLIIPLSPKDRFVGALGLRMERYFRQWTDEDKRILRMKAMVLAQAVVMKTASENLERRLRYERALSRCSRHLHFAEDEDQGDSSLGLVLRELLLVAETDRVYVFENSLASGGELLLSQIAEACAEGIEPQIDNEELRGLPYDPDLKRWRETLSLGDPLFGDVDDFPLGEREILEPQGIRSILVIPFFTSLGWRGFIGFDSVRARRVWDEDDVSVLKTVAELIGTWYERRETRAALRESEELHRLVLNSISEAVFVTDDAGDFTYVGPNVDVIFGLSQQAVVELGNIKRLIPDVLFRLETLSENGFIDNLETRVTDGDGEIHDLLISAKSLELGEGTTLYCCRDVTELKSAQERNLRQYEQLAQTEKMATLGTLVSGVGHEINNPNTFIMLNAPMLERMWDETIKPILAGESSPEDLADGVARVRRRFPKMVHGIKDGAERIRRIVRDLKDFARQDAMDMSGEVNVNDVVNAAVTLVMSKIKQATDRFELEPARKSPMVRGNYQRLEQVVINLLINACEALTNRGQRVKVRVAEKRSKILIEVIDEGKGIPANQLDHVCDPFHTTKRDDGGTGLGLSISSGIVSEHGGELRIESNEGEGTLAVVELPAMEGGQ